MAQKRELESKIVDRIMRNLKKLANGWFMKVHGGAFQAAGIPDIIGVLNGYFMAFEVKRPGETPTKLQEWVMEQIRKAGALVRVVYSWEDVKTAIDEGSDKYVQH